MFLAEVQALEHVADVRRLVPSVYQNPSPGRRRLSGLLPQDDVRLDRGRLHFHLQVSQPAWPADEPPADFPDHVCNVGIVERFDFDKSRIGATRRVERGDGS